MTLIPALQPIVSAATGDIVAYEALARWNEEGNVIKPQAFRSDWIETDIAMVQALCAAGDAFGQDKVRLFINVSDQTLAKDSAFSNWMAATNELVQSINGRCVIEITEEISDHLLRRRWASLRALDVDLAVDDFGDGQSQLRRLRAHDWDYCKFDAKRTIDMRDAGALLYCHNTHITTIIEKVETQSQRILGTLCGLDWQQGYFFAMPKLLTDLFCAKEL